MNNKKILILPKSIDNVYKGNPVSKYVFLVLTMITVIRSLIHIFAGDGGAQSIATIPLDSYTSSGSATVIMMFALWGLSQLLMGIVYSTVYLKYKSLIPAMYVLLIIEYTMRVIIGIMKPIDTLTTAPGGIGNYVLIPLSVIMLFLSLTKSKRYKQLSNLK